MFHLALLLLGNQLELKELERMNNSTHLTVHSPGGEELFCLVRLVSSFHFTHRDSLYTVHSLYSSHSSLTGGCFVLCTRSRKL